MAKKIVMALCAAAMLASTPAFADGDRRGYWQYDNGWHRGDDDRHEHRWHREDDDRHGDKRHKEARKHHGKRDKVVVIWRGDRRWSAPRHAQTYRYGYRPLPAYRGHDDHHDRHYRRDGRDDWALYAILALQLVNALNDSQQQNYAWAQERAVAAPIGESIQWQDNGAYGSVTAVRDGTDTGGRYCREFQHEITVGNRVQEGYGIACRQPDGAWEIVS